MRFLLVALLISSFFSSCAKRGELKFSDPESEAKALAKIEAERAAERERARIAREEQEKIQKKLDMDEIVASAKEEFKAIEPLMQRKCASCHDATFKLPLYGRIFPSINPVKKHQVEGLLALDFSQVFPLNSQGNASQISLLKAIRASAIDRTMPLRSYTLVYPKRKIFDEDEAAILAWTDPLIAKLEAFDEKYKPRPVGPAAETLAAFEQKCFRCHANGVARGGFGGMEKMDELRDGKFSDRQVPENSKLYKVMANGSMPPDPRQRMTQEELQNIRDWMRKP